MEQVARIRSLIEARFPQGTVRVDQVSDSRGPVWFDLNVDGQAVAIEWRQGMDIGITSLPSDRFGDGVDEVYKTPEEALARVQELFTTHSRTVCPREATLAQLRSRQRISQEDLAQLLNVSQPNVSKTERRADMSVSTLRALIEAIGGQLEVNARFGADVVRLSQFDSPVADATHRPRTA